MMDLAQRKEQYSVSFVQAVAAAAGYNVANWSVDDDSIDLMLGARGPMGTTRSPRLELQLKCTSGNLLHDDGVHFQLSRKNYDDLRDPQVAVPRILVVVLVPELVSHWTKSTPPDGFLLRRHAWWCSLRGEPDRPGVESPTVVLRNPFDPAAVDSIFKRIAAKGLP